MNKHRAIYVMFIFMCFTCLFTSCWMNQKESGVNLSSEEVKEGSESMNETQIPNELVQIPEEYKDKAAQQVTLKKLNYTTYESMTYEQKSKKLNKIAYVYLPYGYSESKEYNIFYLMNG